MRSSSGFRADELTTQTAKVAYQRSAGRARSADAQATRAVRRGFRRIAAHCRQCSIEFLATPFSVADLERLLFFGVRAVKIASTDLNNAPLLRAAADSGLPLLCSTGAATAAEIRGAVRRLRGRGAGSRLVLLHCISSYPTPLEAANLRVIAACETSLGFRLDSATTRCSRRPAPGQ